MTTGNCVACGADDASAGPGQPAASANPRQLITDQHVDDPLTAKSGMQHHHTTRFGRDLADDRGMPTGWMCAHGRQQRPGMLARHHGHELALIGEIEGVEARISQAPFTSSRNGSVGS